jgi:hypothetical protein
VGRHQIAEQLTTAFESFSPRAAEGVTVLHGDFRVPKHLDFIRTSTVLFVNNANGVFSGRSNTPGSYR